MRLSAEEALEILGITEGDITQERIKHAYRKLCAVHHPDRGGKTEAMQIVNLAYARAKLIEPYVLERAPLSYAAQQLIKWLELNKAYLFYEIDTRNKIWIDGDTYDFREVLKRFKCRWNPDIRKWYFQG
jgi:hypothetical protein